MLLNQARSLLLLVVITSVVDEVVNHVEDDIKRLTIGEALEESTDLGGVNFEVQVTVNGRAGVLAVVGNGLSMANIFLEEKK